VCKRAVPVKKMYGVIEFTRHERGR
jgi:hypothetical protein